MNDFYEIENSVFEKFGHKKEFDMVLFQKRFVWLPTKTEDNGTVWFDWIFEVCDERPFHYYNVLPEYYRYKNYEGAHIMYLKLLNNIK